MNNAQENYEAVIQMTDRLERLLQLAEECTELAHAALKLVRVMEGTNPTPVNMCEAEDALMEEIADVLVCMDAAIEDRNFPEIERKMDAKIARWRERLEAQEEGAGETTSSVSAGGAATFP